MLSSLGVQVLFEIGIDGDAGVDPDFMILWISQSELGLPSKVSAFRTPERCYSPNLFI